MDGAWFFRAPEPTDIYWEHLDIKNVTRIKRTITTYFVSFLLICVSFIIIYALNILQDELDYPSLSTFLDAIISVVISVVNIIFKSIIVSMTAYEEMQTDTLNNFSIGIKLTLVRFVNTSIIPIAVDY